MPTNTVKMIVNPKLISDYEKSMMRLAVDHQETLETCDAMDALLWKLTESYSYSTTLGDIAADVNVKRKRATDSLARTLIPAPVKRKKRRYTRRKPVSPLVATIPAKKKSTKKKAVKKNATKK